MGSGWKSWLLAAAASAAFATVAVSPALVALVRSPDFPVQAFTVDDGLYLQRAIGAWHGADPYEWTYYENAGARPLAEIALERPNAVVDVAAGAAADLLGLAPAGLAVFLDWTCGALSFALMLAIFRIWASWPMAAGAAILASCFPAALIPDPLLHLPKAFAPSLVSQPFIDHAAPAFRAVYTQASYPAFLLAVLLLVRHFVARSWSVAGAFGIGALGGLCGHGYFFPWLAVLAIGAGLPLLSALLDRAVPVRRAFAVTASFGAGWLAGSVGVLAIMASNQTSGIVADAAIGRYWWLPVERLLLGGVLIAFAFHTSDRRRASLAALLGWLLLLELPLMNVQPVLRQGLAPYHFPGLYLHPFVTGGAFLLLVEWLDERLSLRLLARAAAMLPLAAFCFDAGLGVRTALHDLPLAEDLGWLVRRLHASPPDAVFAMSPIEHPFSSEAAQAEVHSNFPNFVATLSGRYTLHQDWMFHEIADDTDLRRELGMAWLLTGRMQPMWTVENPVELPGDLFTLTWTFLELRRRQKLDAHGALVGSFTPCRFLSSFRVDLLVHDESNDGPLVDPARRFLRLDASSPNGTFDVYRFDQARAAAEACSGS